MAKSLEGRHVEYMLYPVVRSIDGITEDTLVNCDTCDDYSSPIKTKGATWTLVWCIISSIGSKCYGDSGTVYSSRDHVSKPLMLETERMLAFTDESETLCGTCDTPSKSVLSGGPTGGGRRQRPSATTNPRTSNATPRRIKISIRRF